MANWSNLKTAISNVVKSNGIQGITGDSLQSVMLNMVTKLGENYMFAGVATPATTPGTPDGNVFYITTQAGTYANFNNTVVADGELAILMWNGAWTKQSMAIATQAKMEEIDQHVTEVVHNLMKCKKVWKMYMPMESNGILLWQTLLSQELGILLFINRYLFSLN